MVSWCVPTRKGTDALSGVDIGFRGLETRRTSLLQNEGKVEGLVPRELGVETG